MTRFSAALIAAALFAGATPAGAAEGRAWSAPAGYTFAANSYCGERLPFRTIYRVCEDQMALLQSAIEEARRDKKLVLVVLGATWCPWCNALNRTLRTPDVLGYRGGPVDLDKAFVPVEIAISTLAGGRRAPVTSGEAAMRRLLASMPGVKLNSIPFVAVIDPDDESRFFATNLDDVENASTGAHDPAKLRALLTAARDKVVKRDTASN